MFGYERILLENGALNMSHDNLVTHLYVVSFNSFRQLCVRPEMSIFLLKPQSIFISLQVVFKQGQDFPFIDFF